MNKSLSVLTLAALLVQQALQPTLSTAARHRATATRTHATQIAPTVSPPMPDAKPEQPAKAQAVEAYGKLPLSFEANQGQTDPSVKFLSRGDGYTLFLTPTEAVLALQTGRSGDGESGRQEEENQISNGKHQKAKSENQLPTPNPQSPVVLRMQLVNANPTVQVTGQAPLPGKSNYFTGNDPKKWHTDVPTYAKVHYDDVYLGIDLVYYGNQHQLEYDFVVAPGADPKAIRLSFAGADKVEVDAQGDLVLHTAAGQIRQHKPFVYQDVDGVKQPVAGNYVLHQFPTPNPQSLAPEVSFQVAAYDTGKPLVIDPVLSYSTYLGGSNDELALPSMGIAIDQAGNILVTGTTASADFPLANAQQPIRAGIRDAFVTKLTPDGSAFVYSTYLGGRTGIGIAFAVTHGNAIAVDTVGNAYLTGFTGTTDFPTTSNAFKRQNAGGDGDAFITKLNVTGGLAYSTFLGGRNSSIFSDEGRAIAADAAGNAYVTGFTAAQDNPGTPQNEGFPTTPGSFQPTHPRTGSLDAYDAFVTKLDTVSGVLRYSSLLAGDGRDEGNGIAVDADGNAYITGRTLSLDFPMLNAFQSVYGGMGQSDSTGTAGDAFVTKVNAAGSVLVYSSYLGGRVTDIGYGIAVDSAGAAYVTGRADSDNFPTTAGAFKTTKPGGSSDGFVAKVSADGAVLTYATYLGADNAGGSFTSPEEGHSVAVDTLGNAYVTGNATQFFPQVNPVQPQFGGALDAFVAKLNPTGTVLLYSTFLGGNGEDRGYGRALDAVGNAYVAGLTRSTNFPTVNPLQGNLRGPADAFVAKISDTPLVSADLAITNVDSPDPVTLGSNVTYTLTVTNNGPASATGVTISDMLPTGVGFISASSGCSGTSVITCTIETLANGASATISLVTRPTVAGGVSNTARVSGTRTDLNPTNNVATAVTTVSPPANSADLAVTLLDAPDPVTVGNPLTYTITVTNNGPAPATGVTLTDTRSTGVTLISASTGCTGTTLITCSLGTLAQGSRATVTLLVTPGAAGVISNTAQVRGNELDPNPANNTASQSTTVAPVGGGVAADLALTMSDAPDPITPGKELIYALIVTNNGLSSATGVTVTDTLPANVAFVRSSGNCQHVSGTVTCAITLGQAALASGGRVAFTITVRPTTPGQIHNTARVSGAQNDPNPANNTATAVTDNPNPFADLVVTLTDAPDPSSVGQNILYTVTISNNGPMTAPSVKLTEGFTPGNDLVSVTPSQGSCSGPLVRCDFGAIANGASATVRVVRRPIEIGQYGEIVSVSGAYYDPNPANDFALAVTTVN